MNTGDVTYVGGSIFDGHKLHTDVAIRFRAGRFQGLWAAIDLTSAETVVDLAGDILSPGYVDLQVNGGGGVMFNDDPSLATLARMADAHRALGVSSLLPTLITDSPEKTTAAIAAVQTALAAKTPGIAGLHLEGPHLSVARKGAHDPALIRPMNDADLSQLLKAKKSIDRLKVTVAPENVTSDQVSTMAGAGILVSLGHTDADFDTCCRYADAGARCATHLFNAMSQLGSREPGLVGAALTRGDLSAGIIADTVHVHPDTLRTAWRSKMAPGGLFLVSDAMAVAGTDQHSFDLGTRRITRGNGKLTLADGTLAGADLDITRAVHTLVHYTGVGLDTALTAATTTPANLIGLSVSLQSGQTPMSQIIKIAANLSKASPLA